MEIIDKILDFEIFHLGKYNFKVESIIAILIIFIATKLVIWLIRSALNRKKDLSKVDKSNRNSLFQIIKYILWIISFSLILDTIGINVTVLLAGSAALLVGIGLGLQQTFNDVISGIMLLIEGTTKAGDILEIDNDIVMLDSIGLRTSMGLNRDDIVIIIPNSLITTNKVINWSHQSMKTRFRISVRVAYGSDVDFVKKILEESVLEHPDITNKELIEARLVNFGISSLDFEVLFFSQNVFRIEKVKGNIRMIINRKFNENNISIPFPQMDIHYKPDNARS